MTNVNIDSGTIDGSNITVGGGKTLDVSTGTLTLADNQISGDKIEDGTINSITINNLAGAIDFNSQNMTNVNIDSGNIDNTIIGGGTPAAGSFSTLSIGNFTFPNSDGTSGQVLKTNGSGSLTWQDDSSGGGGDTVSTNTLQPQSGDSGLSINFSSGDENKNKIIINNTLENALEIQDNTANTYMKFGKTGTSPQIQIKKALDIEGSIDITGAFTIFGSTNFKSGFTVPAGQTITLGSSPTFNAGFTVPNGQITLRGVNYTFPNTDGATGQVLTTDGNGNLSWTTPS